MNELLDQLGLDKSFFLELVLVAVIFISLSRVYFRPFLKLVEARHRKTVEDREAAERLMLQAQTKLDEYKRLLSEERNRAKKEYEAALAEAHKQENQLMAEAREDAKKLTQETIEAVNEQRDLLRKQVQADVEVVAQAISEQLLAREAR